MNEREGVIQYRCTLHQRPVAVSATVLAAVNEVRSALVSRGWIGRSPDRYHGLGFGNISVRTDRGFLITATQTGHLAVLTEQDLTQVVEADIGNNHLIAEGSRKPSSEALTHAAIYQAVGAAGAVVHIHAPALWHGAEERGFPVTPAHVPYGTPAMADTIGAYAAAGVHVIVMGGHEDGVLAWGADLAECSHRLSAY